jgi:hypothetical protein
MSSKVENTQADLFKQEYSFTTGVKTQIVSQESDHSAEPHLDEKTMASLKKRAEFVKEIYQARLAETEKDPKAFGGLKPEIGHILFSLQKAPGIRQSTIPTLSNGNFSIWVRLFNHLNKLNGQSFKDEQGLTHTVRDASPSCWDRTAPDDAVPGARVVEAENKDSIFYGGRPDSEKRAVILGEEIFKNEWTSGKKKGIKDNGDGTYELTYLVGSLTNTLPGLSEWRKYVPGAGQALDERDSLQLEVKTLNNLRQNSEPIKIVIDGREYKVRLKPMHTHCMVSCFSFYKFFKNSGQDLENKINSTGYQQLIAYYNSMDKDKAQVTPQQKAWADEIIKTLKSEEESTAIAPHLRLAMVDMLAQICKLPVVLHCKSVVDRTSGAGAVSIANRMVLDGKMNGTEDQKFADIIKENQYKQNFVKALQAQLSTSSDLRSAVNLDGSINTDRVLPGYEWHEGVDTVAFTFAEFIPKGGLKPITTMQKVKNFAIQLFVFTITLLAYCIGVGKLLKLPLVRPTWLKPTQTFDHESYVLSEDGTRPLLVGPHHRRMKEALKKEKKSGKLDPSTLEVMQQKAILQGHGFSPKEIARLKLLKPGVTVNYRLDLNDFYQSCPTYNDQQLKKDLHRTNHTLDGQKYPLVENEAEDSPRKDPIIAFVNTAFDNDESQKKYLSQILTQTALASVSTEIAKRYQLNVNNLGGTPIEFIIDREKETVTVELHYVLSDLNDATYHPSGLDVKVVFPFNHTQGADVEWTVVDAKVSNPEEKARTVYASDYVAPKVEPAKTSFSSRLQDFATSSLRFLKQLFPSAEKLE